MAFDRRLVKSPLKASSDGGGGLLGGIGGFLNSATQLAQQGVRLKTEINTLRGKTPPRSTGDSDDTESPSAEGAPEENEGQAEFFRRLISAIPENVRRDFAAAGEKQYIIDLRNRAGDTLSAAMPFIVAGGLALGGIFFYKKVVRRRR